MMIWDSFLDALAGVVSAIMTMVATPVLTYFLVINSSLLALMGLAGWEFVRSRRRKGHAGSEQSVASQLGQGVSVVVPSYNEEVVIVTSVRALLALRFARHEVIVVDDGSTDATAWWRLEGWWASVRGRKQVWGTMTQQGFGDDSHALTALRSDA